MSAAARSASWIQQMKETSAPHRVGGRAADVGKHSVAVIEDRPEYIKTDARTTGRARAACSAAPRNHQSQITLLGEERIEYFRPLEPRQFNGADARARRVRVECVDEKGEAKV
jgi:hypothetical protein